MKWLIVVLACFHGGCALQPTTQNTQRGDAAFVQRQLAIAQAAEGAGDLRAAIAAWRAVALLDDGDHPQAQIRRLEERRRQWMVDLLSRSGGDAQGGLQLLLLDDAHPTALRWLEQHDERQYLSPLVFSDRPEAPTTHAAPMEQSVHQPDDASDRAAQAEALYQRGRLAAASDLRLALELYEQALTVQPEHAEATRALQQTQRMLRNLEAIRAVQ